jgi:hypothetical protein
VGKRNIKALYNPFDEEDDDDDYGMVTMTMMMKIKTPTAADLSFLLVTGTTDRFCDYC